MNPPPLALCLHCELAPQEHYLRLCQKCASVKGIRLLYKKTSRWTPEPGRTPATSGGTRQAKLPLFPEENAKENRHEEIEKFRSSVTCMTANWFRAVAGRALAIGGQLGRGPLPALRWADDAAAESPGALFLLLLPCPAQRRGATRGEENRQQVACP